MVPNAHLIRAVLEGKIVQMRPDSSAKWLDMSGHDAVAQLVNHPLGIYRLKPEPVVLWATVKPRGIVGQESELSARAAAQHASDGPWKVLRIELDPDTLQVISGTTME